MFRAMLFNSIHFLVFLPTVAIVYFALPLRYRRVFLLAASFYFYWVWSVKWSLLLIYTIVQDYVAARIIGASARASMRKAALISSLAGNLLVLGVFKYFNFFSESLGALFGTPLLPTLNLILPMGISFYTFESMSYTIDVYRGILEPARSLLEFALFVTFFPHLVAGPIMRGGALLPQFREHHAPNSERILSGVLLCVWGLMKKVFVADPMGAIVEAVYGSASSPVAPSAFSGMALLVATYAFAIQIYCDFSGYSDIARGAGRILGFRIMKNFDSPYLATTVTEFWRRWHISLSTWLRDYLYIPLGGNRHGTLRTYVNLILTMLLGGLWHGANWTFVAWGGLHGLYLSAERMAGIRTQDPATMRPLERGCRMVATFHLVCLGWVFFRSPTLEHALEVVWRIVSVADGPGTSLIPLLALASLVAMQMSRVKHTLHVQLLRRPEVSRWFVYGAVALLLLVLAGSRTPEFIYFQF